MFNIEEVPQYRLSKQPLVQALAQVRFPMVAALQSFAGIETVQSSIIDLFPYMQQQQVKEFGLQVGPAGVAASDGHESTNWEFTDDNGRLLLVAPGSATLSEGLSYSGIDYFTAGFESVLRAIGKLSSVRRCDRLGVRYLSLAELPSGDSRVWTRWFRPELVGWPGSEVIDPSTLVSSISQVELATSNVAPALEGCGTVRAVIRHGLVPAGAVIQGVPPVSVPSQSYLIDIDIYVSEPQQFDASAIALEFRALHNQIDRFFHWSLSEEGLNYFGYEETA